MKSKKKIPEKYRKWNGIVYDQDIWIDELMGFEVETQLNTRKFKKIQRNTKKRAEIRQNPYSKVS
jgi:hypothetical protein